MRQSERRRRRKREQRRRQRRRRKSSRDLTIQSQMKPKFSVTRCSQTAWSCLARSSVPPKFRRIDRSHQAFPSSRGAVLGKFHLEQIKENRAQTNRSSSSEVAAANSQSAGTLPKVDCCVGGIRTCRALTLLTLSCRTHFQQLFKTGYCEKHE